MDFVYQGAVGLVIRVETGIENFAAVATRAEIKYKNSQGTGTWTGVPNGSYMEYTTQANDLNVLGTWTIQADVTLNNPVFTGLGKTDTFEVRAELT